MSQHPNSLAAYSDIRLSDREAVVLALYQPGIAYTDDDLAALDGKANSRETSPRITGLRDKGLVIENRHGATKNGRSVRTTRLPDPAKAEKAEPPHKPHCNCTWAGFLIKQPSKKRPGYIAVVCTNPIHGAPKLYGYEQAGSNQ